MGYGNNMNKCYLLGAGASKGYTESKSEQLRPPGSWEVFLRGRDLGLLDKEILPDLYDSLQEYIGTDEPIEDLPPSTLKFDIEDFLSGLANKYNKNYYSDESDKYHSALGQSFYFIYELFRHYQMFYSPRNDNYQRLALHYFDKPYQVISLNYDTLFETAIQRVGLSTHYGLPSQHHPNAVKIAKIHGSINWRVRFHGIEVGNMHKLSNIAGLLFSNIITGDAVQFGVLPVDATAKIDYRDYVRSSYDFGVPAIIPPVAGHKRYERFDEYKQIHEFARNIIHRADKLVIIGCSLRPEDVTLFDLLDNHLTDEIELKIVCRSDTDKVANKMKEIVDNPTIDTSHTDFTSYARSL